MNDAGMSDGPTTAAPLTARELATCVALAIVLALAMHWPLPLHLGRDIAQDLGDPLVQAWQVAWDGHALAHQPLRLFQANMFWPQHDSLAFSDALVGYAPAGLIGSGTHAAVARYDVLFLFAYALCFAGAYLLARELGAGRAGSTIAGAAFAFAPYRLEQEGHLHIISSGAIPLALFLLIRGYRRARAATIVAGWLVASWQFSLGFSLGLPLAYLVAAGALAVAVVWLRRGRPAPARRIAIATATGMLVFALTAGVLARPYMRVLADHHEVHRTIGQVAAYSGPLYEFIAASGDSRVWSVPTRPLRNELNAVPEQTLFPGLAILALALAGLRAGPLPRRLRRALGLAALGCAILSLGFKLNGVAWLYPYRWLYELLPGWQAIRVPGRLHTFTTLCLALARRRRRAGARRPRPPPPRRGRGSGRGRRAVRRRARRRMGLRRSPHRAARPKRSGAGAAAGPAPARPPGGQPPLRPVVDRRLPEARQRPRELPAAPVQGVDRRHGARSPISARSRPCAATACAASRCTSPPRAARRSRERQPGRCAA